MQGGLGGPLKRGGEAVVENFADDFYMLQVDVDPNGGNGCDVWVRYRDPNNGYRIRTPAADFGATITLSRVKDGQATSLGTGSFPLGGVGTVKVKIYNDAASHRFKVWVNGGLQINLTDSTHLAGGLAFAGDQGGTLPPSPLPGRERGGVSRERRVPTLTCRATFGCPLSGEGWDRGREDGLTSPLPPNRTCGFPAFGSPVSGSPLVRTDVPAHEPSSG